MLTSNIGWTQSNSNNFRFNEDQVRTMARVKLEYIHLDSLNMTLTQALMHCDSVRDVQRNVIFQLDDLLIIKEDQIVNLKQQNIQRDYMYVLLTGQVKKERKLKWIFLGSTVVMAGFLALSLL